MYKVNTIHVYIQHLNIFLYIGKHLEIKNPPNNVYKSSSAIMNTLLLILNNDYEIHLQSNNF